MKTELNKLFTTFLFALCTLTVFGQSVLSEVGTELKEGAIWTENCQAPAIYHLSDTLAINGNFDGVTENTRFVIDGQLFVPVWETRDEALFVLNSVTPGKQAFEIQDSRLSAKGDFQVIQVNHYLSKSKLKKGEDVSVKVEVKGLDGWDQPLTIELVNPKPELFSLAGGEKQDWVIYPGEASVKNVMVNCLEKNSGSLNLAVQVVKNSADFGPSEEVAAKR